MPQPTRVALLDVLHTVELPPAVAVAIVGQVAARIDRWVAARRAARTTVPRIQDLRLERGGRVYWTRGRSVPVRDTVRALGALLDALLARAANRPPVPALLYIVARATDPGHLAPIESVRDLAAAIARHAPERPAAAIDALIARYLAETGGARTLGPSSTIADVRRRRRAGGTPLTTIAHDTQIPVSLLRELEWGVFDNWPLPLAAGSIAAYAARAGMDPNAVVAIVSREQQGLRPVEPGWPMRVLRVSPALAAPTAASGRALPFALAAVVALLVAAAAPSDPSAEHAEHAGAAAPVEAAIVEPVAADEAPPDDGSSAGEVARPPETAPAIEGTALREERATPGRPPRATVRKSVARRPAFAHDAAAAVRNADGQRPGTGETALIRLSRALAGDGRYKVAPFPKPAGDAPR